MKKVLIFSMVVAVIAVILVLLKDATPLPTAVTDYVPLNQINESGVVVNLNNTFPNPACTDCTLAVKPKDSYTKLLNENRSCSDNEDCSAILYSQNPHSGCSGGLEVLNTKGVEKLLENIPFYFTSHEASESGPVCGISNTYTAGVRCDKRVCVEVVKEVVLNKI